MIFDHRTSTFDSARRYLSALAKPLYMVLEAPVDIRRFFSSYWPNQRLSDNYDILLQEYFSLQAKNQQFEALEAENRRLLALLSANQSYRSQVSMLAEVVQANARALDGKVVINRGKNAGVFVGQAVVDASGLLGQITQVGEGSSQVILVTDPAHAVPIENLRTGLQSLVRGEGEGEWLSLPFISPQADIEVGDVLVTSGLGGVFPRDHPVAEVVSVRTIPGEPFLSVYAQPLAAINRTRYVMLIDEENTALSSVKGVVIRADSLAPTAESTPELSRKNMPQPAMEVVQ